MAEREHGMSTIVKVVTRWIFALTLIFGLGVAFYGHLTPGGGFAGGVVIACGFVLATLAFGSQAGPVAWMKKKASTLDAVGALLFLAVAVLGYLAGHFIQRWIGLGEPYTLCSTWFIVLMNLAILLKVGAGLFAGFMAIAVFGVVGDAVEGKGDEA
jgi:multicomponent Na+:H+ antiporter subunit B